MHARSRQIPQYLDNRQVYGYIAFGDGHELHVENDTDKARLLLKDILLNSTMDGDLSVMLSRCDCRSIRRQLKSNSPLPTGRGAGRYGKTFFEHFGARVVGAVNSGLSAKSSGSARCADCVRGPTSGATATKSELGVSRNWVWLNLCDRCRHETAASVHVGVRRQRGHTLPASTS